MRTIPVVPSETSDAVVMAFKTGEIWTIDTFAAQQQDGLIPVPEGFFAEALPRYVDFLRRLGVTGPLRWEAGIEGVAGRRVDLGNGRSIGPILNDVVCKAGFVNEAAPDRSLIDFFNEIYAECGVEKRWID